MVVGSTPHGVACSGNYLAHSLVRYTEEIGDLHIRSNCFSLNDCVKIKNKVYICTAPGFLFGCAENNRSGCHLLNKRNLVNF